MKKGKKGGKKRYRAESNFQGMGSNFGQCKKKKEGLLV